MKTWSFSAKLTFFIVASVVIAVGITANMYSALRQVERSDAARAERVLVAKNAAYQILESVVNLQTGVQATLRLKDPDEIEKLVESFKKQATTTRSLITSTTGLPPSTGERFTALVDTYQKALDQFLLGENSAAYEVMIDQAPGRFEALLAVVREHSANVEKAAAAEGVAADKALARLLTITLCICGVVIAGFVMYGWIFRRTTTRHLTNLAQSLSEASTQVSSAAAQVSQASQALAQGSTEQASSIEETSASLEEMSGMTKRNSENATNANQFATQARQSADASATDIQAMNSAMNDIKGSSDDIAKIIKTIDEIAFQTNILALNAAVEAARAGEAGAGFAVVAEEVRNLAQRSAQAARETAAKIEGAISKTAQGVQISGKVATSLGEIVDKVRRVDTLVSEVATASLEQSQGVQQINGAVGQMDKVVQSNAAAAEETASAAQQLSAQAAMLMSSVSDLRRLIGGSAAGENEAPADSVAAKPAGSPARPPVTAPKAPRLRAKAEKPIPARNGHGEHHGLTFEDM
ncbi:methyl-accepting chemotaxis protein [Opitutus sp. ER46]|uniref:methyl-accepting chemotaxis protein n=1 Tax=Opitutus sp. ER46 TaxID=2161864 RepID=UPI000D307959|nr:methyl-accepting chemotaxis protein [Opitutus sp. ER46]PTX92374.1 hypothetical protein DB354_13630 [Opitutus sp. ER46]